MYLCMYVCIFSRNLICHIPVMAELHITWQFYCQIYDFISLRSDVIAAAANPRAGCMRRKSVNTAVRSAFSIVLSISSLSASSPTRCPSMFYSVIIVLVVYDFHVSTLFRLLPTLTTRTTDAKSRHQQTSDLDRGQS